MSSTPSRSPLKPGRLSPEPVDSLARNSWTASLGTGGRLRRNRHLSPFVVELALKALVAKHNDDEVVQVHRLSKLYDELPARVQVELAGDFEHIKHTELLTETRSAREILVDHDNDFPDWRYLDDPSDLVGDPIDALQYVACSVLNVYHST